jgi:plastocyanin
MFRVLNAIAIAGIALAMSACGGADQSKSAEPPSPASAPDLKTVDDATAGSISGKVVVDGTLPPNAPISMESDPACEGDDKQPAHAETFVTSDGGLENVFVYIKDDLGKTYRFEVPSSPLKLEQKRCHYVPHVLGIRVGQPLQITNDDGTMHNVHGLGQSNREFNFSQPVQGMKNTITFTKPEVMMPFKCDVHSWMHAYIGVVDHPYFAVTGNGGTFELRGVPPGTYTIEAWHEKLGTETQSVTLGDKGHKEITFTFKAPSTT